MQNATCRGSDARQQAGTGRIRNAQDLRNRLGGGISPDSLTRAATPFRIAEGRQPPALGPRGPSPKGGALLRHYCLQYKLDQLVDDRVRRRPMALSTPEPSGPIYRGLTTTMSPVSLGRTQQPPGGLRGERCYILWRAAPKQKPMTQVFAPDLATAKLSRNPMVGAEDLRANT
jgi:hypothetical protein